MVDKVQEWGFLGVLFAHEKKRHVGGKDDERGGKLRLFKPGKRNEPFAEHAVSYLVVVL
jgi:hypothetical protein